MPWELVGIRSPALIGGRRGGVGVRGGGVAADLHGNYSRATQPCVVNAVICILLRNVFEEKEPPDVAHGGTGKHYHPSTRALLERMNN